MEDVVYLVSLLEGGRRVGGLDIRRKHERVKVSTLGEKKKKSGRC